MNKMDYFIDNRQASKSINVIAEWGQIYLTYFHLIMQTSCLGVFVTKNVMNFMQVKEFRPSLAFKSPFISLER